MRRWTFFPTHRNLIASTGNEIPISSFLVFVERSGKKIFLGEQAGLVYECVADISHFLHDGDIIVTPEGVMVHSLSKPTSMTN